MPNYYFKISNHHDRDEVLNYLELQKIHNEKFTVVDVGGSVNGWSSKVVDAIIDFNDPFEKQQHCKHFKCDITHPDSWKEILQYVHEFGKFDFCICTHTLEDIINPSFVSEQMSKIAKAGYIAVPSKYRELSRFENGPNNYRGYIHHRWIFDVVDNIFIGYPKINYIDSSPIFDTIADISENRSDLSFYWKENIDIRYINNNYLGPNVQSVMEYYNQLLQSTL